MVKTIFDIGIMGRNWTGIFHFLIAGFTFDFCLIRLEPTITGNKFEKKGEIWWRSFLQVKTV